MTRSLALLLFIACVNSSICAQLSLRFSPLSMLDFYSGASYKLGAELDLSPRWSITAEYGRYLKKFNVYENYTGFNLNGSVRRYLIGNDRKRDTYLSVNVFYKEQGFDYRDTIPSLGPGLTFYRTEKFVTHANVNMGHVHYLTSRIYLDVYAGLGIRYKKVNSTVTREQLNEGSEYWDSMSLFFVVTPGTYLWPNLNLGMRVGWRILD